MKKNRSLIVILALLISATVFFIFRSSDTTIKKELSDFAVKDTASISKFFLADRNDHQITLERKENGQWLLNGKDEPRPENMQLLLDAVYKMDVRTRVSKAGYNNVIKMLSSSGVKCEVYFKGQENPVKVFYVGGQTEDALGTFMMLENSSMPFIMEIPGFSGYLTPRFSVDFDSWKRPSVFAYSPKEIKSISISYANFPDNSFIINSENGKYIVQEPSKKFSIVSDSIAIENYLGLFRNVNFEEWARGLSQKQQDSILEYPPSIVVIVKDNKDSIQQVDLYPMAIDRTSLSQQDSLGHDLKYDLDKMYGYLRPQKEFVVIQHYNFDPLLRRFSDFRPQ